MTHGASPTHSPSIMQCAYVLAPLADTMSTGIVEACAEVCGVSLDEATHVLLDPQHTTEHAPLKLVEWAVEFANVPAAAAPDICTLRQRVAMAWQVTPIESVLIQARNAELDGRAPNELLVG